MSTDDGEREGRTTPAQKQAPGKKNAAALAAALRANLARRKARERALRADAAGETAQAQDPRQERRTDSEAKWTK